MLGRALKIAFWVTYDHLGKLIVVSLIWSAPAFFLASLGAIVLASQSGPANPLLPIVLTLIVLCIALPPLSAGICELIKELLDTRDGSLATFWKGIRQHGLKSMAIGFIYLIAITCLTTSIAFYAWKLHDTMPLLGYGLSALSFWCLIFVLLSAQYALPALIQKKGGVAETIKLSAVLVLDNPFMSIGLALNLVTVTVLVILIPPAFFFIYGSVTCVLSMSSYEILTRKYGRENPDEPIDHKKMDEQNDYLNRGFRDFLFPWKG